MHFTVVFRSHESYDLSYSILFTPCPVWTSADRKIVNLHPESPEYSRGDLQPLLAAESVEAKLAEGSRDAVIVIHDTGYGTQNDLATLRADLVDAGFTVRELRLAAPAN